MANSLLSPDADQDEALNKGQQHYDDRFAQIAKAEEDATFNDITDDFDKPADWSNNTGANSAAPKSRQAIKTAVKFIRNKGVIAGGASLGGLLLILLFVTLAPASMLFNLMENISSHNDSSSTAMERRFMKVFGNMTNTDNDVFCANSSKSIKCRMGRISNNALHALNKKGIVAEWGKDKTFDGVKKGYPDKNPTHYKFTEKDGSFRRVAARDLPGFLAAKENRKLANRVLGTGGAFNLRAKAWTGKHINKQLYKKFNIGRSGGVADGKNGGKKTARERLSESMKKVQDKIPGMETADKISNNIKDKVGKHIGKASKGGAGYLTAVAGCIGVRAPGYIASGVAAVQLMQVMPYFMETIGSPASKAKQSAIGSGFTAEDADAAGSILTSKKNGKSPLDSQILLSALGVNKAKAPVAESITPGYSILTDPKILAFKSAEKETEEACNAIMSPAAMYTAMVTDAAITFVMSSNPITALIKIGGSIVLSIAVEEATKAIIGAFAEDIIMDLAKNDVIPKAEGEELGDVIGVSAMAFFSIGGLSRHLPVLSKSQAIAFNDMKLENEQFQKEMDIASLSPFDISSRHTFLGSIVYNTQTAVIANGGLSSTSSLFSSLLRLPLSGISQSASASNYSEAYCDYAEDFGLSVGEYADAPCITASGLPGVGLTSTQASMGTSTAIDHMIAEGWIDGGDISASESATIDELFSSKVIKEDTPLREFIETCSNPEDGSYLFSAAGCMAEEDGGRSTTDSDETVIKEEVGEDEDPDVVTNVVKSLNSGTSLSAMTPFLLDYQIVQSINGEDDESGSGNQSQDSGAGQLVGDKAFPLPDGSVQNATTYAGHQGVDLAAPQGTPIFAVAAGTVKRADDVCTARGDGCNGDMGNVVTIDHGNGILTRYLHMLPGTVRVKVGDTVSPGKQLGEVGSTGRSTGDHLHFDVWEDGARIGDVASFEWLKRYNILPSVNKEGLVYHD